MGDEYSLTFEDALVGVKRVIESLTSIPQSELQAEDIVSEILASDSLSWVEYKVGLEEAFRIVIPDTDIEAFDTLASSAIYVSNIVNSGGTDAH